MVNVNYEILQIIMPFIIVIVPSFLVWSYVSSRAGLLAGATIGVAIGVNANVLPTWTVTVIIIALVAMIYFDRKAGVET